MEDSKRKPAAFLIEKDRRFIEQLKYHEGFRPGVYRCTKGARTIGYGHNLDANPLPVRPPITRAEAAEILMEDCAKIAAALDRRIPWWRKVCPPRQAVILNMAFNLGTEGLLGFHSTLACIEAGDFALAAQCMEQSRWHRQVGKRAAMLEEQMRSGEWR